MVVTAMRSKINGSYQNVRTKVSFFPQIPLFPTISCKDDCKSVSGRKLIVQLLSPAFSYTLLGPALGIVRNERGSRRPDPGIFITMTNCPQAGFQILRAS